MEKKIVVCKRFRINTLKTFDYLIKEHSEKTAFDFLNKLQRRIELIIRYSSFYWMLKIKKCQF